MDQPAISLTASSTQTESSTILSNSRLRGEIDFHFLGSLSYEEGLKVQETAVQRLLASSTDNESDRPLFGLLGDVLALEHKAVVTLGKRGRPELDLMVTEEKIRAKGVQLFVAPRGGQATLHSPGQLVIYPCMNLTRLQLGVRDYVCVLEKSTQAFLKAFGIDSWRNPDEPGLYTSQGKIAFFGIKVSQGMSSHGISINVTNDTSLFGLIRSCGKEAEKFDRMVDHGVTSTPQELFFLWKTHFLRALS